MKFSDYVHNLNVLLKERPETADLLVVSSKDDEGNGFNIVSFSPQVGSYDKEDKHFKEEQVVNAVCIN